MPYARQFRDATVWMATYYVPSELLPAHARDKKGKPKTRIYEAAQDAGYPNSQKAASQLETRRNREIAAGTYSYSEQGEHTASTWVSVWTDSRSARRKKTDQRRIEMHFCTFKDFANKKLSDFRPGHFREWAEHGREIVAAGKMEGKTFRNVYGVVRTMFQYAVIDEKIPANPCVVRREDLPAKRSKKGRRYENEESSVLVWCEALPADVRMLFCLLSYTGERVGEGCGHIWQNWDPDSEPLGALTLEWAYDRLPLKSSTDKERPRVIPVHPELASALEWWKREGWEAFYGRRPNPDDPIIPNVFKKGHHTEKSIYHRSRDAFEAAGLGWKAHHACRHAFITAVRRRGAPDVWSERITHNASGTMLDNYTHTEWDPVCEVVMLLPWKRIQPGKQLIASQPDPRSLKNAPKKNFGDAFGDVKILAAKFGSKMEREKGFEPSTSTLARLHSTTELLPR